jgi:hypothetical protein
MTPNEKAKELVNKFYNEVKYMERAKECALIAVREILNEYWWHDNKRHDYWQGVKQEIEKL